MYFFFGAIPVLLLVTAIITYAFLHQKKVGQLKMMLYEEDLRSQQAIFNALQEGQEKERARLAEELHDGIGAKLSGLKMTLEYLKSTATENAALVSKVFSGVAETLEEVREISHNLQPYYFNDRDLEQLLLNHIEQLNASTDGCRYDLLMNTPVKGIGKTIKLHTYRIITELLNNIHKHARANLASVQINAEDDTLEIVVEDNGIGMDNARSNSEGIGLMNINNRINVCKGKINIDSSEKGSSVIIEIPLNTTA